MSENWLIIECVCLGLIFVAFIIVLVRHFAHKKVREQNKVLTSELSARDTLLANKDSRIKETEDFKNRLESDINCLKLEHKEELDAKDVEITAIKNDHENILLEKNTKIDELEVECERLRTDMDNLVVTKEELDTEHLEILDKNTELNKAVLAFSEKYEELEKKYNALLIENDFLKNYETENTVLIKTLRRLKEDEENDAVKTKDAIVALETRLNKKIEATFDAMTAKIVHTSTKLKNLDADLSSLKRTELSKIAKKCGIKNFATWSNEKLIKEIKKYKV